MKKRVLQFRVDFMGIVLLVLRGILGPADVSPRRRKAPKNC